MGRNQGKFTYAVVSTKMRNKKRGLEDLWAPLMALKEAMESSVQDIFNNKKNI